MPGRGTMLVSGKYYHIMNRGVASMPIFSDTYSYKRALDLIHYYRVSNPKYSYSFLMSQEAKIREKLIDEITKKGPFLVSIVCFCFMPNHVHFLLKQEQDGGISKFMSNFTNSYTRYFNEKNNRIGHLFQGRFKAVLIDEENQLFHVSRYIHLNPLTSNIVKTIEKLRRYKYSSYSHYIGLSKFPFISPAIIYAYYNNKVKYQKFVEDQADYQKKLHFLARLTLEE